MIGNIFAGAASGVAANKVSQATETTDHMREHTESLACIHQVLCEIKDALDVITSGNKETDYLERINLSTSQQYMLNDRGLRHTMIYSGNNTNTVTAEISGVGTITISLTTGWNLLDLPDGTILTSAQPCSLIYKASNWGL